MVASDKPLSFDADATNLTKIQLDVPDVGAMRKIKWSSDSSVLFDVIGLKSGTEIEFFDSQKRKIGSGYLPTRYFVRDGWFSNDKKSLILNVGLSSDESGQGVVIRCNIAGWKCNQMMDNVADASSDGGMFTAVRGTGKPPISKPGGTDYELLSPQYAIEVDDESFQTIVRQSFSSVARPQIHVVLAPSGTKVMIAWAASLTAKCPRDKGTAICETGVIVDLSGRRK
jgi:hypothetical protein